MSETRTGIWRASRRWCGRSSIGLVLLMAAAMMVAMPAASARADTGDLRVLHWNIWGVTGNHGTHEVVDRLIDRVERLWDDGQVPHFISINETCREQAAYAHDQLEERLGTDAVGLHFAESSTDRRCSGGGIDNDTGVGLIVLGADRVREKLRYWFNPNGDLYGRARGDGALTPPDKRAASCMLASFQSTLGHDVLACSAHLATSAEGEANKQAVTLVRELEAEVGDAHPIVLAGDLNLKPGQLKAIYAPDQAGHGDFLEVDWPENRWTWGRDAEPTTKLDYIFGDQRHLNPTSAQLFDGGKCREWWAYGRCSDHYMVFGTLTFRDGGGGGGGGQAPTRISYEGPSEASYHDSFTVSATLTASPKPGADPTVPVSGATLNFTLGVGGGSQRCAATTNSSGVARCTLTVTQRPGKTSITVRYAGDGYAPSTLTVPFTVLRQKTTVLYTGTKRIANGDPANLSGELREKHRQGPPIAGRRISLGLGHGEDRQHCSATTDSSGTAQCTIQSVDQPLNDDATVPVDVSFTGDAYYRPSNNSSTVLLEYYTGRAYGVTGTVDLPLLPIGLQPTPDTGAVRTARASTTPTACAARVDAPLVKAAALCPKVTTSLAPGTSKSSSTVDQATIDGIPGVPTIEIIGANARSTSTCAAGGSTDGSADLTLRIGGRSVEVPTEPNSEIEIPGIARLVVNEQVPVLGADYGSTVNAVHLTASDGLADVVVASATSDVHNCAP